MRPSRDLSASHIPTLGDPEISEESTETDAVFFGQMRDSLSDALAERVVFETVTTSQPLQYAVVRAREEGGGQGDLVVVGRGRGRGWVRRELVGVLESVERGGGVGGEARGGLGDVGEALVVVNKSSVVVVQAGRGEEGGS